MRLIDAEHLTKWILSWWEQTSPTSEYLKGADILAQIDREPTIDAENVVHGKWIDKGNWMGIECSRCKCHSRYVTPFCPQCGARMKGTADE